MTPAGATSAPVEGHLVAALLGGQRLIVELDGHAAHATPAAVEPDRRRELALRAAGYRVLRYTWQRVAEQPETISADLRRGLSSRESAHERRPAWHD